MKRMYRKRKRYLSEKIIFAFVNLYRILIILIVPFICTYIIGLFEISKKESILVYFISLVGTILFTRHNEFLENIELIYTQQWIAEQKEAEERLKKEQLNQQMAELAERSAILNQAREQPFSNKIYKMLQEDI